MPGQPLASLGPDSGPGPFWPSEVCKSMVTLLCHTPAALNPGLSALGLVLPGTRPPARVSQSEVKPPAGPHLREAIVLSLSCFKTCCDSHMATCPPGRQLLGAGPRPAGWTAGPGAEPGAWQRLRPETADVAPRPPAAQPGPAAPVAVGEEGRVAHGKCSSQGQGL
ncbi:hypothetical protein GHT09_011028 [Marmota monax]|uniref:Uncharacterized protein n=1 Tax=Marmota monax TaxID=9995 RepID=A0A834V1A4_MARMO|nr:hypothetical protein GHT09_011028 [Marmota monax]